MKQIETSRQADAFLNTIMQKLSSNVKKLDEAGNLELREHTVYRRLDITGGASTYDLLKESTNLQDGIVNIQNRKFNSGNGFIFDSISVGYSRGAQGDNPASKDYVSALPAILRNSDLIISQSGREILRKPISDFYASGSELSYNELQVPLRKLNYIIDDSVFDLKIQFPEGETLLAGTTAGLENHFFELKIHGFITDRKR